MASDQFYIHRVEYKEFETLSNISNIFEYTIPLVSQTIVFMGQLSRQKTWYQQLCIRGFNYADHDILHFESFYSRTYVIYPMY